MKRNKVDIICPIYWTNQYFEDNIASWIKEIPVNNLILGINNNEVWNDVDKINSFINNTFIGKHINYCQIIDQTKLKTLGGCLVELMKQVNTKWFAFVHSDVFITPFAYKIMEQYIKPKTGIIESERLHWNSSISKVYNKYYIPSYLYSNYYNFDRAFSGFQIFQKKAIETAIKRIEDDYIYRNEDLIFQYDCIMNGYEYWKTLALHIHQNFNTKWTFERNEAFLMQVKGLIKYTEPLPRVSQEVCLNSVSELKSKGLLNIYEIIKFCNKYNKKKWKRLILKKWDLI